MWITVASPKRPLIAKQPDFDARRGACRDAQATDCGGRTALRRFFARHNISFKKESLRAAGHRDRELIRCEASRMVKNSSGARYPFTALRGGNNASATPSLAALHRPLATNVRVPREQQEIALPLMIRLGMEMDAGGDSGTRAAISSPLGPNVSRSASPVRGVLLRSCRAEYGPGSETLAPTWRMECHVCTGRTCRRQKGRAAAPPDRGAPTVP